MFNQFEEICINLSKNKHRPGDNLYVCAEKAIKEYLGTDRKKMLQIKAQAEGGDFYSFSATLIASAALLIALGDVVLDVPNAGIYANIFALIKIVLVGVPTIYILFKLLKYKDVLKWRKYILTAISELYENK